MTMTTEQTTDISLYNEIAEWLTSVPTTVQLTPVSHPLQEPGQGTPGLQVATVQGAGNLEPVQPTLYHLTPVSPPPPPPPPPPETGIQISLALGVGQFFLPDENLRETIRSQPDCLFYQLNSLINCLSLTKLADGREEMVEEAVQRINKLFSILYPVSMLRKGLSQDLNDLHHPVRPIN